MTKTCLRPSAHKFRIQRSFATHKKGIPCTDLLSRLFSQHCSSPSSHWAVLWRSRRLRQYRSSPPPGPVSHFVTRFDVVDAPEQFDQVLMIVDFPVGTWTPPHTPGGYVYTTVIEGEIATRMVGSAGQD